MTPDTMFHAAAGGIGILSGIAALVMRKGSEPHRAAGNLFAASMIITGLSAIYLGVTRDQSGNAVGGVLVVYMLATAWVAAKRQDNKSGLFEIGAFLISATGAVGAFWFTLQAMASGTALMGGVPGFIMSGVAALTAALDLRVVLRRGLAGKQRIARHLWRMHLGFFAAVGSFFPGQLQFFPEAVQQIKPTIVLFFPAFSIVLLMFYWLVRVLFTRWYDDGEPGADDPAQLESAAS